MSCCELFFCQTSFFKIALWVKLFIISSHKGMSWDEAKKSSLPQLYLPYVGPTMHKRDYFAFTKGWSCTTQMEEDNGGLHGAMEEDDENRGKQNLRALLSF
jgi:hypothetical protein